MKTILSFLSIAVAANAWAQFGGPPQQGNNSSERLARLFGKQAAFSATAHIFTTDARGKEKENTTMSYALLDGKLRMEPDITKAKSGKKRSRDMETADEMGFGEMVILVRPDKKAAYMIYPGLKAYCELPPSAKTQSTGKDSKTETTDLGKETVDNHPCIKQQVVITSETGEREETLQWLAHDLKDFPVQVQMKNGDDTVTTTFRDVKHGKPDAALFELPADFTAYGSMQELMMGAARGMMGGQ